MTPKFTDRHGKECQVEITTGRLTRVRKVTGIPLGELLADDTRLAKLLYAQPEEFANVLYFLTGAYETAEDSETFSDRFNATALEAARLAVVEAIANFFLPPAISKAFVENWRNVVKKTMGQIATTLTRELQGLLASNEPAGNSAEFAELIPAI